MQKALRSHAAWRKEGRAHPVATRVAHLHWFEGTFQSVSECLDTNLFTAEFLSDEGTRIRLAIPATMDTRLIFSVPACEAPVLRLGEKFGATK